MNEEQAQPVPDQGGQVEQQDGTTTVKVTILDSIVSVNSLFTIAVFLGFTFSSAQQTLVTNEDCRADKAKEVVLLEILSFSCFLFSSIIAQGLKMAIVVLNGKDRAESESARINWKMLYIGMWSSGIGSVAGSTFLIWSIVDVIQIRLGKFRCHDQYSHRAVLFLVVSIVAVAVGYGCYIGSFIYAAIKEVAARNA